MIPHPDRALTDLATRIGGTLLPALSTGYGMADAGMIAMLLQALALEAREGIERRMTDGRELKEIFASPPAQKAPGVEDRAAFVASEPESFSHDDVSAWLDGGLTLLIDLHAWAESDHPVLNRAIWEFLDRHSERHRLEP
jgi:hypothetical protein